MPALSAIKDIPYPSISASVSISAWCRSDSDDTNGTSDALTTSLRTGCSRCMSATAGENE